MSGPLAVVGGLPNFARAEPKIATIARDMRKGIEALDDSLINAKQRQ